MFNRGTMGVRSALHVSVVRARRRGFATSMANVSMQVPRSVGPLPFVVGAAFQGAYLVLYDRRFRHLNAATIPRSRTLLYRMIMDSDVQPEPRHVHNSS
jgi:hypothetical protein